MPVVGMRRLYVFLVLLLLSSTLSLVSGVIFSPAPNPPFQPIGSMPIGTYDHIGALFTPSMQTYNVTGELYYSSANPHLCSPDVVDLNIAGKIVLAYRMECDFLTRAQIAELNHAIALIIMDDQPGSTQPGSAYFDTYWLGPSPDEPDDPPAVQIPVIMVTGQVSKFLQALSPSAITTATIDQTGLYMNDDQYWAQVGNATLWEKRIRIAFNLSPFLIVAFCYWFFYQTWRGEAPARAASPAAAQQAGAGGAVAAGAPAPGAAPSSIPMQPIVSRPPRTDAGDSFHPLPDGAEQLSLPVPPHLADGSENGMTDVALDVHSSSGNRGRGASVTDEHEHKDNEGLISPSGNNSSGNSIRRDQQANLLDRPLLPVPAVAVQMKLYYHFLKALSAAGKPTWILRFNAFVYAIHTICAFTVLIIGWNEKCLSQHLAMVSLWAARGMIGFRICYWQCHSSSAVPTCADIFFKNWSDCIYLFTGSMFTWSESQKVDCQLNAPTIYRAVEAWTVLIYVTYGLRLIFYMMDRYSQRHNATLPHIFTITARSCLSIINGGFSCAGALDKNQPATQLDLMLIPTVTYREGMYSQDDALCGVCLGEYSPGETLRLLNCSHHFHSPCVDTWLLQKNTCPTCRAPIDSDRVIRRPGGGGVVDVEEDELRPSDVGVSVGGSGGPAERPPSPSRQDRSMDDPTQDETIPPHSYYHAAQVRRDVPPL